MMKRSKLTKFELVDDISEKTGIDSKDVKAVVDSFFTSMKAALAKDMVIELRGFGTFQIKTRKGRERARNPKTGDVAPVESHGVTIFRPGKELKTISWPIVNKNDK